MLDLLPSDSYTPTLHLVAYSVNQKGRSEPTVLEDIAINEAEKRTGTRYFVYGWDNVKNEKSFSVWHDAKVSVFCASYKVIHITSNINSVFCSTAWKRSQYTSFYAAFLSWLKGFTRDTSTIMGEKFVELIFSIAEVVFRNKKPCKIYRTFHGKTLKDSKTLQHSRLKAKPIKKKKV